MKSTPVKDMGAALLNLTAAQTNRRTEKGDFQKVWNSRMEKETGESQTAAEKQPGSADRKSDGGKTDGSVQIDRESASKIRKESQIRKDEPAAEEELSSLEKERAMELLGTAALELMRQIVDIFGISMEELQTVMGEMNVKPMELLDTSTVGNLLLELAGARDAWALVTNEALYQDYQAVMEQVQTLLEESGSQLDMEPEELTGFIKEASKGITAEVPKEVLTEETAGSISAGKPQGENEEREPVQNHVTEESRETVQNAQEFQDKADTSQRRENPSGEGGRQSGGKADQGEHTNIMIQNIRSEQFRPDVVPTAGTAESSPWTEETRNIMDQIMDYMKLRLSPDSTSLEMQLHPASLGTLQVQIASKGGVVTANFITQNEAVKSALESQMIQLRESFEEQGVRIEAIEVTVQTHEFERNLEQGRGRNQQTPERRNRARRIPRGDGPAAETGNPDVRLTAGRMTLDGSTVSYRA